LAYIQYAVLAFGSVGDVCHWHTSPSNRLRLAKKSLAIGHFANYQTRPKKQERGTSLADQRAVLEAEGYQEIYADMFTGKSIDRPEFDRLCSEVQPGDTIMVQKWTALPEPRRKPTGLVLRPGNTGSDYRGDGKGMG